jgi:UDP-glucuronate 4-epimerase
MKILVTGSAGFIGFHLTLALLREGHQVTGIDNINDYYDVGLKYSRLAETGIDEPGIGWNRETNSTRFANYSFIRMNLEDKEGLLSICKRNEFNAVINLAAQAGVRYSIVNPDAYVQSNLVGFLNILEACRQFSVAHLVYASSSSVYGLNEQVPFSVRHAVNHPVSLYAATKKSNELMAHVYSHLYQIPTTGLRFFTVYGPWGRPDMATAIFTESILNGKPIQVFNKGKMKRDFTYVDDVIRGILKVLERPATACVTWDSLLPHPGRSTAPYRVYNIGNNQPVPLIEFIKQLEKCLGTKAIIKMRGMQPGDVPVTWADVDDLISDFSYSPSTSLEAGLKTYTNWYQGYYAVHQRIFETVSAS